MMHPVTVLKMLLVMAAGATPAPVGGDGLWVALGDSITEGFTYPLWVSQSLSEAGWPTPTWINAGVAGDTAGRMLARLEEDVIRKNPSRVFFNAGVNDVVHGESPQFEENVDRIFRRLREKGISVCVVTTTAFGGKHAALTPRLAEINGFLRRRAAEMGFSVAEVFTPFLDAVHNGRPVLEDDGVHLTLEGYRIVAAAVLQTIDPRLALSASFEPQAEPGILKSWQIRTTERAELIAEISLPEARPLASWWHDQERRRGYLMDLKRFAPEANRFHATGFFELPFSARMIIRIGGSVESLSVDGEALILPESHLKWGIRDAGLTPKLSAGKHRVEAIVGEAFFLSLIPQKKP
jgi:lysophospholipase L1-like esterase